MIVQWLAKNTGKSVVKHPRVQCQLTIVSSKKVSQRDALNLIYRALALEGFTTIESSKSILIVPEGQDVKMAPEVVDSSKPEIPEGRQRLIKVFPLKHIAPGDLKEKIKPVLTDKATTEIDDRSNQLVVTDYNDNIRLLGELIRELDVPSASDAMIELFSLKHLEADELASLLGLILNAQGGTGGGGGASSGGSPPPEMMGGMPGGSSRSSRPSSMSGTTAGVGAAQVRIWPDKTSNRLIVAGPKSKFPELKRLIDLLDTQKPADLSVRVLQLKNVTAEDLAREIGPLYQKISGKSLKETIEITANSRSNSLIILSSEANYKALERLVSNLDTDEAQEKTMRTFVLKSADAEDVAKQLQDLNKDPEANTRWYYFYGSGGNSNGRSKKISVVADRRRNTVVVQAAPNDMDSIAKMIHELDEPVGDNSLAPKIFRLKYVSAVDIEDVLNELFLKKQQQRTYWFYDEDPPQTADRNVGRLYGKVRITSEAYSNSIIVTANSLESLAALEDILKQLDTPSEAGETTLRVGLKFAQSITVANHINILFAKGGSPALRPVVPQPNPGDGRNNQQQNNNSQLNFELEKENKEEAYFPWLGGERDPVRSSDGRNSVRPVSDLVGRVRVVADRRSNALLVTSNVHFFPQVLKLINELDAPTAQVLIEAKIVEVSTDFRDKLGVRWSADGAKNFSAEDMDGSLLVKGTGQYQKVFAGNALAESLKTGILDSKVSLDLLVQFLRKNTDSTVLAEPQINIADNELGKLFVGAKVPFISGSLNISTGGRNDTFEYRDVGIILDVTPHINNSEDVSLRIRAESSSIRQGETLFGGAILDTRNFRTDLNVRSGQTVVLGGIIQKEQANAVRKVPILGSIPGLGWAFKKKDKVTRDVELMVFLRPKVTRTPDEAKELLGEIDKRTPRIRASEEEFKGQAAAEEKARLEESKKKKKP